MISGKKSEMKKLIFLTIFLFCLSVFGKEGKAEKQRSLNLSGKTFQSICEGELSTKIIFISNKKAEFIFHEFWPEDGDNAGEVTYLSTVDYKVDGNKILIERVGIKYVFSYSELKDYPNSAKGLRLISLTGTGDKFFNAEGCQKILVEQKSQGNAKKKNGTDDRK